MRVLAAAFSWFPGKWKKKQVRRAARAAPGLARTINSRSGPVSSQTLPATMTSGQRLSVRFAASAMHMWNCRHQRSVAIEKEKPKKPNSDFHSMSPDPSVNAALYHSRSGGRKPGSALLVSCRAWGAVMPQRRAQRRLQATVSVSIQCRAISGAELPVTIMASQ